MPLFQNANISTLDNPVVARLVSNSGGFEVIPLGDGYCRSVGLWRSPAASGGYDRMYWEQEASNTLSLGLIFELRPHYGRLLTTALARVYGQSYSVLPTQLPRLQLLRMNAATSVFDTAWDLVDTSTDLSTTPAQYNAPHYIALPVNHLVAYGYRYALNVVADQSAAYNMLLEGLQVGYAFTV